MRRSLRRAHRRLWPFLAAAVAIGLAAALILRPAIPLEPAVAASGSAP